MKTALHIALPLLSLGLAACIGAPEPGDDDTDSTSATTIDDSAESATHEGKPVRLPVRTASPTPAAAAVATDGDNVSHFSSTVASTSSGMSYHGGSVMTSGVNVYLIWYGSWSGNSATTILTDLVSNIGGSTWFNINTTYASASTFVKSDVTYAGSTTDAYSSGTSLSDASVKTIVSSAITGGALPADTNGVYFVLTSSDVSESSGFCTSYCGWHDHATISGKDIKYSFVGNPDRCPSACEAQSSGPNGNAGADGMASILAHELAEATTDPDLNAWYDSTGYENADKCAWTFGTTYNPSSGVQANMKIGSRNFLIQRNWVNTGSGSCAQSYGASASASNVTISGTPYVTSTLTGAYTFSDSADLPELGSTYQWYRAGVAIAGATSATYSPTGSDTNSTLTFCVTPADFNATGTQVCSSAVTVPGVTWYTGESQTGTATSAVATNGACVDITTLGAAGSFSSLRLDGRASGLTTILMYKSSNCSGTVWSRSSGANTVHDINLDTVGIGSAIGSYKISW